LKNCGLSHGVGWLFHLLLGAVTIYCVTIYRNVKMQQNVLWIVTIYIVYSYKNDFIKIKK